MNAVALHFHEMHKERRARMEYVPLQLSVPKIAALPASPAPEIDGKVIYLSNRAARIDAILGATVERYRNSGSTLPVSKTPTIPSILKIVAANYNLSVADIQGVSRVAEVVRPRQVAMFLAKHFTGKSLPDIGRRMGGRDHTTVLHSFRKIERLMKDDIDLFDRVEDLKVAILEETRRLQITGRFDD